MVKSGEFGVVLVAAVTAGMYQFWRLPGEVREALCTALPCVTIGTLGIFLFLINETKRVSRGG